MRSKKYLFAAATILAAVALMEAGSYGLAELTLGGFDRLSIERTRSHTRGDAIEEAKNASTPSDMKRAFGGRHGAEIAHPYLGYVFAGRREDHHGFISEDILKFGAPENFNVVFVGGSVAGETYVNMRERVQSDVRRLVGDRPVNVFLWAVGGYKQPQQLMAVSYFLALGAKIDLVVNIDGYNELAIAWFNYRDNMDISMPFYWRRRVASSERAIGIAGRGELFADWQRQWAATMDAAPWSWSPTATVVWSIGNRWFEGRLNELRAALQREETSHNAAQLGRRNPASLEKMLERAAGIWSDSNSVLASLLKARGVPYVHMLQPNQYVRGSKPLSDNERRIAFSKGFSTVFASDPDVAAYASDELNRLAVPNGYDALRARGAPPNDDNFIEGTMLFANVKDDIYIDDCCHVNRLGTDLIWAAVLRRIEARPDMLATAKH